METDASEESRPPHKSKKIYINTTKCRSEQELLRKIIAQHPKTFEEVTSGDKGDIMWFGLSLTESEVELIAKKAVNRFPGMREAAQKKILGEALNLMAKYYPEEYDFFPKTYTFPEDYESLQEDMESERSKLYIVKPTAGSQGDGIYLIKKFRELNNFGTRNLEDLVVQEYLSEPLLVNRKKFDLRVYAIVTGIDPITAFVCDEGLARFCTEDYEPPTNQNLNHGYMHLTNYSLNKRSEHFVHTDELFAPNNGSKQTLTSLWNHLASEGKNVDEIKQKINQIVAKTLMATESILITQYSSALASTQLHSVKCFQIIGVDIILDQHCKPWLLEINANPSLRIDFEEEISPGVMESHPSILDEHVKMIAVSDAFRILKLKKEEQLGIDRLRSYVRVLPGVIGWTDEISRKFRQVFKALVTVRDPEMVSSAKFRNIGKWLMQSNVTGIMLADFDIIYRTVSRKYSVGQLSITNFIYALVPSSQETIAKRLSPGEDPKTAMEHLLSLVIPFT